MLEEQYNVVKDFGAALLDPQYHSIIFFFLKKKKS